MRVNVPIDDDDVEASPVTGFVAISDQKRLVRGEHWLAARNHLRIRDRVHHRSWKILILAGGAPEGEIGAIHAVMPRAHIVAVDRDEACVEAARRAGADEAIRCDLIKDIVTQPGGPGRPAKLPAEAIMRSGPYDAISLDLCAGISDETKTVFEVYRRSASRGGPLTARGVVILTFSYGRDVVEWLRSIDPPVSWIGAVSRYNQLRESLSAEMLGRLTFLVGPALSSVNSVMLYRGARAPMCSVLLQPGVEGKLRVVKVEAGDFELAVECPDPTMLYDCPRDRILALRQKHAAIRAAYKKP